MMLVGARLAGGSKPGSPGIIKVMPPTFHIDLLHAQKASEKRVTIISRESIAIAVHL